MGHIGRGTHYSILRSVEWLDVTLTPSTEPHIHDFAVIWDEDHDTRVIEAIERLYMAGLLACVQFIAERKGTLSVVIAARAWSYMKMGFETYKERVQEVIADPIHGDYWPVEVGFFDRNPGSPHQRDFAMLIQSAIHHVEAYCLSIDALWSLGTRPWDPRRTVLNSAGQQVDREPLLGIWLAPKRARRLVCEAARASP